MGYYRSLTAAFLFLAALVAISADASGIISKRCKALIPEFQRAYKNHPIPAAALASQVVQESSCKRLAKSHAGAVGLTQFTKPTLDHMAAKHRITCNWREVRCALRLQTAYMKDLWLLSPAKHMKKPCDRWAVAATAYNGGRGWSLRDYRRAKREGGDYRAYWKEKDGFEAYHDQRRADWAIRENEGYPRHILRRQVGFQRLGWMGVCT